ncbi:MAG: hypothetical protein BGO67_07630 [Alphaproteobacteria bacterium 41-28]|nr:MAG: hypothetical protein BGO67_07630 [Alphaproteobacteria bacterium 41-28]
MTTQNDNFRERPYFLPIETISSIKFTQREIDIIVCLLGRRTAKKIALFLSISPKTVENHIRNIMQKLECNSRESIIDFIESSEEVSLLKQRYTQLICHAAFEQSLKEASSRIKKKNSTCVLIYGPEEKKYAASIFQLEHDLKSAGLNVTIEVKNGLKNLDSLTKDRENRSSDFLMYALPKNVKKEIQSNKDFCQIPQKEIKSANTVIFLICETKEKKENIKSFPGKAPKDSEELINYYCSFFGILKSLFPSLNLEDIFAKLRSQLKGLVDGNGSPSSTNPMVPDFKEANDFSTFQVKVFLKIKEWKIPIAIMVFLIICLSAGFISFKEGKNGQENQNSSETLVSSDLIIPAKFVLLDRPELISEIDEKLKERQDIQTIALVGIGGSGKKVLARQYARQQKAPVVWEMNAETQETLLHSFAILGYVLSKSEEDKRIYKALQDIKNPQEREEKIVFYVREKLRSYPNWLLIYYNVANFGSIQKYFPQEVGWGKGKVIITTRDSNIQNNSHINHIVILGELDEQQRLDLFTKILNKGSPTQLTASKIKEAKQFLNQIPPFPLDVSVAAYYLKETKIPYEKYIEYMSTHNNEFDKLQENVLKEVSNYEKTRYSIITLSLKQIINAHVDFSDLLLLISLLGSKNIPLDLLYEYKNNLAVDSFIHHLKKYSLTIFTLYDLDKTIATFSLHVSTRDIILDYLTKALNLTENKLPLYACGKAVEKYTAKVIDKEDFLLMSLMLNHCEKMIGHSHLITDEIKGAIGSKIGFIFYYMGSPVKSEKFLVESLKNLYKSPEKNYVSIAFSLAQLGNVYKDLGQYEKAKETLEQSLKIYKENLPDHYAGMTQVFRYLGNVYRSLGNYEKAKEVLEEALVISERHLSKTPINGALALANLGNVYRELGHLAKAKNIIEQSLQIYKQHFPKNHIEVVRANIYLGRIYQALGHFEKAKNLLEQGLEFHKRIFGENNVRICFILKHLGNVYRELGDFEKAKSLIEESLQIYENNLVNNHIEIAHSLTYLGRVFKDLGQYSAAKDCLNKSYITYVKHYGQDHIETARVMRDLGRVSYLEGDITKGEELTQKALEAFQKSEHPEIYTVYKNLSELSLKKSMQADDNGDHQHAESYKMEAQAHLKQALEVVKNNFPTDSPHIRIIETQLKSLG